jgi:hypothetical protein
MSSDDFQERVSHGSDLSNIAGALQRHRQAKILNQQTSLLEEQNRLLRGQEAERQRLAALPKCPECMQPVEYKSRVCSRCMVAVYWLDIVELENLDRSSKPKADKGLRLISEPQLESALIENSQRLEQQSSQIKNAFKNHIQIGSAMLSRLQRFQDKVVEKFTTLEKGKVVYNKIASHEEQRSSLKPTIELFETEHSVFGTAASWFIAFPVISLVVFLLSCLVYLSVLSSRNPYTVDLMKLVSPLVITALLLTTLVVVALLIYAAPVSRTRRGFKKQVKKLNEEMAKCQKTGEDQFYEGLVGVYEMLDSWFKRQHDYQVIKNIFDSVIQSHSGFAIQLHSGENFRSNEVRLRNCVVNSDTKYSVDLLFEDAEWFRQTLDHLAEKTGLKNLVPKAQPSQSKPANSGKGKVPHQYWIKRGKKIHGPFDAARVLNQSQKNKFKIGDRLGNFQDGPWALLSSEHLAKMQTGADVVIS